MNHIRSRTAVCTCAAAIMAASSVAAQTCPSTISQTQGPYYQSPTPETTELRIGTDGPRLDMRGRVVDQNCNPLAWTWIAIWHADPTGGYDNTAPFDRYRANFFTDANGEFVFHTIVPGLYPGRTKHIHWKVDGANTAVFNTQTYFPGVPQNATDGIYNPALLIEQTILPDGTYDGFFQFVIPTSGTCTGATIIAQPVALTVQPGATATFTANGAGSTPRTYRWYRDGVELANDGRISGAYSASLVIANTGAADAGVYTCRSANSCGNQLSVGAPLTVAGGCPTDLDGDGVVGGADLSAMLVQWGACKGCEADVDADGSVGASDLSILLATWGSCDQ